MAGLYTLTWKTPSEPDHTQSRVFAANLVSESEGRIDADLKFKVGSVNIDARDTADSAYTPLWPYAIGVCLLVLMIEWWVYHRKAYI
jgi:hypothetical protein